MTSEPALSKTDLVGIHVERQPVRVTVRLRACKTGRVSVRMNAISPKKSHFSGRSRTSLCDEAFQQGWITEAQYTASLPPFQVVRPCYLRSVLDQRLWSVMDDYVQYYCKLAAAGSMVLNLWALEHWQTASLMVAPLMTDDRLLGQTFVKRLFDVEHARDRLSGDVRAWVDEPGKVAFFQQLMAGDSFADDVSGKLHDQTLNAIQRSWRGHVKVHLKVHLAARLEAVFRHQYEVTLSSMDIPTNVVSAMLTNSLAQLPEDWQVRVIEFREAMDMGDIVIDGSDGVGIVVVDETDGDEVQDPAEEQENVEQDDDDDDEADAAASMLRSLWPIHCRAVHALTRIRAELDAMPPSEHAPKRRRIPTASLLPLFSYKRSYAQVDARVLCELAKLANKRAKTNVPVPTEGTAFSTFVRPAHKPRGRMRRQGRPHPPQQRPQKGSKKRKKRAAASACSAKKRGAQTGFGCWPKNARLSSLRTDGIGARLCFQVHGRKPGRLWDREDALHAAYANAKRLVMMGLDPGDVNPFTANAMVMDLRKGDGSMSAAPSVFWQQAAVGADAPSHKKTTSSRLSSKTYYRVGLVYASRRDEKRCRTPQQRMMQAALAQAGTWKTTDPATFVDMCNVLAQHSHTAQLTGIVDVRRAKWKMLTFRRRRSVLEQSIKRAVDKATHHQRPADTIIVGYGNASTRTAHGRDCVPKKELKAAFRRVLGRFKDHGVTVVMVPIDEFRTTMLCRICHTAMQERYIRAPGKGRQIKDRSSRLCTQCGSATSPVLRSRDGNAADNIMYKTWVLASKRRLPAPFVRGTCVPVDHQTMGDQPGAAGHVPLGSTPVGTRVHSRPT